MNLSALWIVRATLVQADGCRRDLPLRQEGNRTIFEEVVHLDLGDEIEYDHVYYPGEASA